MNNEIETITISQRLERMRKFLINKGLSAFVIPSNCEHFGEYVQEHFKAREWMSGFTGSAGTLVITLTDAALWTDSRYFVQAARELDGSGIKLMKLKMPGTPTIAQWLAEKRAERVGVNATLYSVTDFATLSKELKPIELVAEEDPFSMSEYNIWPTRKPEQFGRIELRGYEITGELVKSKYNRLVKELEPYFLPAKKFAYIVTTCDDIAWLCNIRGNDVEYNPIVESYAVVDEKGINLFCNMEKSPSAIEGLLKKAGIRVHNYFEFRDFLSALPQDAVRIYLPDKLSFSDYLRISGNGRICVEECSRGGIIANMKSVKNETEINGFRKAFIFDGIAWCKLLKFIYGSIEKGNALDEYSIGEKLMELREECPDYRGESFEPIVAFGASAALPHYSATKESSNAIGSNNFLLMDTGAQYTFGTTDTTRTIAIGELDDNQKLYYTLVLKGMINLSMAKFPTGTRGSQLDILARGPLFNHAAMFYHGTGHGIGHNLCVHEGPQSIRMEENPVTIKNGMVISNEPAIYFEGKWGIRTENVICARDWVKNEFGCFLRFETFTLVPIDKKPLVISILNKEEIDWLNSYNETVYKTLEPYLVESEKRWLKKYIG